MKKTAQYPRMARGGALIFLALFSTPVACFSQPAAVDMAAIHQEAVARFRAGRYEDALILYRRLAAIQPQSLEASKDLMWALWNSGHFEEAGKVASTIVHRSPDDMEARHLLTQAPTAANREKMNGTREKAVAAYQAGDFRAAIALYRQLVVLSPSNPLVHKDLMWALWDRDRVDEAASVAQDILHLRPGDPDASDVLARVPEAHIRQALIERRAKIDAINLEIKANGESGNYDQMIPLLKEVVLLDPENEANYGQLLTALKKTERYEEGVLVATQMSKVHKESPESWSWLGMFYLDMGNTEEAEKAYQHALMLKPNQPRTHLALGRMYVTLREFDKAVEHLQAAQKADPTMTEAYPLLGKALYWEARYAEAVNVWRNAIHYYPDQLEYRFYEAQSLFYAGEKDLALSKMKQLKDENQSIRALDFMVDAALARHEVGLAERMLEDYLKTLPSLEESHTLKLAGLYQDNGQKDKLLALLDHFLHVLPDDQPVLLMKAGTLFEKELYSEAEAVYAKVHRLNPYDAEGLRGMAECELSMEHVSNALKYVEELCALDPTNASFRLMQAQYYYWAGDPRKGKNLLMQWVRGNQNSDILPIVLYHGLTPFTEDPMLAYPYHQLVATFDAHMRAIHEAGYTAVTSEEVARWITGKGSLPRHPVLITFDDGRLDSFRYGDPILEKYGLKATMMAAIVNIEGHRPPGFVPWQVMERYQKTGRWEIESHGDIAHIHIPIDAAGHQTLFLISRQWLGAENRLETREEWIERLRKDYESSRDKIAKNLGSTPSVYAYPEGIFGQQGHTNMPDVFPVNQKLTKQYYKAAFSQDRYGINLPSRDPGFLSRHEPSQLWTGKDLVQHFRDKSPVSLAYKQLLEWAVWEGRSREAYHWLHRMASAEVSKPVLLAEESKIRFSAGDTAEGHALAQRALMMENMPEVQKSIVSALATEGPNWAPSYSFTEDNQGRHNWQFHQILEWERIHSIKWRAIQSHSEFSETGVRRVLDNSLGGGMDVNLGLFNNFQAEVMEHLLSGPLHNTYSATGKLQTQVTDDFDTVVEGGRSLYYTAHALTDHITDRFVGVLGRFHPTGPWIAVVRGRQIDLSDDNRRRMGRFELSRSVLFPDHLRLLYEFTYDEMKAVSPDYYSPQSLRMHALGPELHFRSRNKNEFSLRYLPAYAAERGGKAEIDQNIEVGATLRCSEKIFLKPSFAYNKTPSYRENNYVVEFQYYF